MMMKDGKKFKIQDKMLRKLPLKNNN
jgi:hypothetical protein